MDVKRVHDLIHCHKQISDFGLAKWLPEKWTHHVVFPIEGTFGLVSRLKYLFVILICLFSYASLRNVWCLWISKLYRYLSPEYFMHGIVDEKTDVFAYGVLLLEIITGRRAVDNTQQSLVIWV